MDKKMPSGKQEEFPKHARVIKAYQSTFPDPIVLKRDQEVVPGRRDQEWPGWVWCTDQQGKSGWVPEDYLTQVAGRMFAACDYNANELTVEAGEVLLVHKLESEWAWCTNKGSEKGWVPLSFLKLQD